MFRPSRHAVVLAACAGLLAAACTRSDEQVFDEIGVSRLLLKDPTVSAQRIALDESPTLQFVRWELTSATLQLGDQVVDLRNGSPCTITDVGGVPIVSGSCASGVVLGAIEPLTADLDLRFTMEVRRARPIDCADQSAMGDCDMDTVTNDADNCILLPNPNQDDTDGDTIGDACTGTDPVSNAIARDSDADGDVDSRDNCVAVPNPDQANVEIGEDFIGDACQQTATVRLAGDRDIDLLPRPITISQPLGGIAYIVADFTSSDTLACDWNGGSCSLDKTAVTACTATSSTAVLAGCPASP